MKFTAYHPLRVNLGPERTGATLQVTLHSSRRKGGLHWYFRQSAAAGSAGRTILTVVEAPGVELAEMLPPISAISREAV